MRRVLRDDRSLRLRARELRAASTPAEAELWHLLRKHALGGWRFRRQAPLHGFIVDFLCVPARLVVELDGAAHDHEAAGLEDEARDQVLRRHGYEVLRIENHEVFDNGDGVLELILAELERRTAQVGNPHPPVPGTLPRRAGEGLSN